jgi:hypothetical protein
MDSIILGSTGWGFSIGSDLIVGFRDSRYELIGSTLIASVGIGLYLLRTGVTMKFCFTFGVRLGSIVINFAVVIVLVSVVIVVVSVVIALIVLLIVLSIAVVVAVVLVVAMVAVVAVVVVLVVVITEGNLLSSGVSILGIIP